MILCGLGGDKTVERAYVVRATPVKERLTVLAHLNTCVLIGTILGPGMLVHHGFYFLLINKNNNSIGDDCQFCKFFGGSHRCGTLQCTGLCWGGCVLHIDCHPAHLLSRETPLGNHQQD